MCKSRPMGNRWRISWLLRAKKRSMRAAPSGLPALIATEKRGSSPRWSPDGKYLAFLSDRAKRGTGQLYLIAADGGEALALTSIKNKKSVDDFAWSPGGGQIAFTSSDEPT